MAGLPGLAAGAVPTNDLYANRTVVDPLPIIISADNSEATIEPFEPDHDGIAGGHSLWWEVVVPSNGVLSVQVTGHPATICLYRGETLATLQLLGTAVTVLPPPGGFRTIPPRTSTITATVETRVRGGQRIQIALGGTADTTMLRQLRISLIPAPANDDFVGRILLVSTNLVIETSNTTATAEPSEPIHGNTPPQRSLWWSWTAPGYGRLQVIPSGGVVAPVYVGSSVTNLVRVSRLTDSGTAECIVSNGVSYHIAAESIEAAVQNIRLDIVFTPPPANDDFAARSTLTGSHLAARSHFVCAGREPDEPVLFRKGRGSTVWWSWTAPSNGRLDLAVSGATGRRSPSYLIGVFTGVTVATLKPVVVGEDALSVAIAGGQIFTLGLDRANAEPGFIDLNLNFFPFPVNDAFSNRIALAGSPVLVTNNLIVASSERGEKRVLGGIGQTVWYDWTAPAAGRAQIAVSTVGYVPAISVFTGGSKGRLKLLVNSSKLQPLDQPVAFVDFDALLGITYSIAVDGNKHGRLGVAPGEFSLAIDLTTLRILQPTNRATLAAGLNPVARINVPNPEVDGVLEQVEYQIVDYFGSVRTIGGSRSPPFDSGLTDLTGGTFAFLAIGTTTEGRLRYAPALQVSFRPPNDDFATRERMNYYTWWKEVSTAGATAERGEPRHKPKNARASVWYAWTAPLNGPCVFRVYDERRGVSFGIYTGDNIFSLVPVAYSRRDWGEGSDECRFTAIAGQTYSFAVDLPRVPGAFSSDGRFWIEVLQENFRPSFPANSAHLTQNDRIPISLYGDATPSDVLQVDYRIFNTVVGWQNIGVATNGNFSIVWTNPIAGHFDLLSRVTMKDGVIFDSLISPITILATNDNFADRALVPGTNVSVRGIFGGATAEPGEPTASLWYSWIPPHDGLVVASGAYFTCYTGTSLAGLQAVANVAPERGAWDQVQFAVSNGTPIQIAVTGAPEAYPPFFGVNLRLYRPPGNDAFADRLRIQGNHTVLTGNNVLASSEPGEPMHGEAARGRSVWYTWTAPGNGVLQFTRVRNDVAPINVAVYSGEQVAGLQSLAHGPLFRFEPVSLPVTAGQQYQIALDDRYGGAEDFEFILEFAPNPSGASTAAALKPIVPEIRIAAPPDDTLLVPLRLDASVGQSSSDGVFRLKVTGLVGRRVQIEFSTDLIHWTSLEARTIGSQYAESVEVSTGNPSRGFFRARLLP